MTTETPHGTFTDWRAGSYGANRTAHLFIFAPLSGRKSPACGARVRGETFGRVLVPVRECPDCRAYRDSWA
jgi:hypothetical protein